ncbi:hypothetical protein FJZ36_06545 [Candidatus Poribacteria bacterium]|nr:hypothetical protein [Candidatus Poribacteria bacterium]
MAGFSLTAISAATVKPTPFGKTTLPKEQQEALDAARSFESLFINNLFKAMRASVPKSGFLPETFASNTYEQLFDEHLSTELSKGTGLGLSEMLYREFMRRESRAADTSSAGLRPFERSLVVSRVADGSVGWRDG